jgi:hypothetical protein
MTRTSQQNRALHKWFDLKAAQCRDAGVTPQLAFSKTMELEMTPEMMKAIWKTVQRPLIGKASTTELDKVGEIELVLDHLNRFFAQEFELDAIPLPSHIPEDTTPILDMMRERDTIPYPPNHGPAPTF